MRFAIALVLLLFTTMAAQGADVTLSSGEVLQGRVAGRTSELIILEHTILGRLEIPIVSVRSIDGRPVAPAERQTVPGVTRPEAPKITPEVAPEDAPSPPTTKALESEPKPKPKPEVEWSSHLEFGATARRGTTDDTNARLSFRSQRKTASNLTRLDATYRLATTRGDRSENNFTTGLFTEWTKPDSRWSAFGQGRFDSDEFQSWDYRTTLGAGLGYRLFDIKGLDEDENEIDIFILTLRAGAGLRKEYGSENDDLAPEGLLGLELDYQITAHQRLAGSCTLYPDLQEAEQFRLVSSLDWFIDINELDGISLKIGMDHEYQSRTDADIPHNDLSAHAALVIDF